MNHPTDSDLVEQTRLCGDKQAFGVLLERYQAGALHMAQRMIADRDTSRELVQEAMLQAYLSLPNLQQPQRFQSWLYGIVINICRSHLRNQRYDLLSLEAISGGLEATYALLVSHAPDPQIDPQTVVEMRELHELVLSAIDTLSAANRQAVLLYYYEQLTLREISLTLGISVTAVKGRLHKSRRQLASYFTTISEPWFAEPSAPIFRESSQERKENMVEVQISDVIIPEYEKQELYTIILLDEAGQRILPIWVGNPEGNQIAMFLLDSQMPRPMTYDFMATLLKSAGAVLEEIQISDLVENTYYATALLRVGETVHQIDARPSDAIALALRMESKVYVTESILTRAGTPIPDKFKNKPLHKGLEQIAVKMEEMKREHETLMASLKKARQADAGQARERLLTYVFGEES